MKTDMGAALEKNNKATIFLFEVDKYPNSCKNALNMEAP